jgi:hypothetical protein
MHLKFEFETAFTLTFGKTSPQLGEVLFFASKLASFLKKRHHALLKS